MVEALAPANDTSPPAMLTDRAALVEFLDRLERMHQANGLQITTRAGELLHMDGSADAAVPFLLTQIRDLLAENMAGERR